MSARALTNEEHEQQERLEDAKQISRELIKVIAGYEAAAAIIAIGLVLKHIGEAA
jgi:hypothetical protein